MYLNINSKQRVKLKNGEIDFTNFNRQLAAPFKTYADFKSILKSVWRVSRDSVNTSCTDKCQKHIPCSYANKVACIDDRFSKPVVVYWGMYQRILR